MSKNDLLKEKKEMESLKEAILLSKGKHNETELILNQLDGEIVKRDKNDRPDVIVKYKNKNNEEVLIGVEHFLIDQASEKQGKKTISRGKENYSHLQRTFDLGNECQMSGKEVPEALKEGLVRDVFKYADSVVNKSYENLITTFETNLESHYRSADVYRRNVKEVARGAKVKIVFLIEIESFLNHMFIVDNNTFYDNKTRLLPVTEDVIELLSRISRNKVDYIVLLFKNAMRKEIADVIALRPEKIRKQLEGQNIKIYRNCGSAVTITTEVVDQIKTGDSYRIYYNQTIHGIENTSWHIQYLKKATEAVGHNIPIVLDRSIAALLFAFGRNLKFKKIPEGGYELITERSLKECNNELNRFIHLFPYPKEE